MLARASPSSCFSWPFTRFRNTEYNRCWLSLVTIFSQASCKRTSMTFARLNLRVPSSAETSKEWVNSIHRWRRSSSWMRQTWLWRNTSRSHRLRLHSRAYARLRLSLAEYSFSVLRRALRGAPSLRRNSIFHPERHSSPGTKWRQTSKALSMWTYKHSKTTSTICSQTFWSPKYFKTI